MRFEDRHFYAVITRHGGYDGFHTLKEAREHANRVMIGYLEGLTCANDPEPTIIKIEDVECLMFNKATKTVCKRTGGPAFGSYRDGHDCYAEVEA